MKADKKLKQLGNVQQVVFTGNPPSFSRYLQNVAEGLYLFNENSMIDTDSIDEFDNGCVGKQAVNLIDNTGNSRVLWLVELMKSKEDCSFFPGTLLRDFGGYVLPVMPVIINGKLVLERPKQTGIPLVDSYSELAKIFGGDAYAKDVETALKKGTPFFVEPIKSLQENLERKVSSLRKDSLKSVQVNGLRVLPVICNEITSMPQSYQGEPIDVTLHASDSLFRTYGDMIEKYMGYFNKMGENEKLNGPQVLVVAQDGENKFKGIFIYEKGELIKA